MDGPFIGVPGNAAPLAAVPGYSSLPPSYAGYSSRPLPLNPVENAKQLMELARMDGMKLNWANSRALARAGSSGRGELYTRATLRSLRTLGKISRGPLRTGIRIGRTVWRVGRTALALGRSAGAATNPFLAGALLAYLGYNHFKEKRAKQEREKSSPSNEDLEHNNGDEERNVVSKAEIQNLQRFLSQPHYHPSDRLSPYGVVPKTFWPTK